MSKFVISPKYKDFLKCNAKVEYLEGTTFAGKTTVGVFKFMLRVAASDKKLHIISGLDKGTVEKNIIVKENGIIDVFGGLVNYKPSGGGQNSMAHIVFNTQSGAKTIYILGYDDKTRWKKALGGQYGCVYIDEINTADMDYVREVSMRCDYLMGTLNPDDPTLPIYGEYINHARPLKKYATDAPRELLEELKETPRPGYVWWYFSYEHNLALSEEKKQQIINNVPPGTKIYKNKILGLRGKATGLVFSNFDEKRHVVSRDDVKRDMKSGKLEFSMFTAGLDTSYSQKSNDTIAMIFCGIAVDRKVYVLDERVYSNKLLSEPIAPSDTVINFIAFLERNREEWGFARNVFIDSADQATVTELKKYKSSAACSYIFNNAYKKMRITDRINLQLGWLHTGHYIVLSNCKEHIAELNSYSWNEKKDNEPEDRNDHTINACQYAWLPYVQKIGADRN